MPLILLLSCKSIEDRLEDELDPERGNNRLILLVILDMDFDLDLDLLLPRNEMSFMSENARDTRSCRS